MSTTEGRKTPDILQAGSAFAADDRRRVDVKALEQCQSHAAAYPREGKQEAIRPPVQSGKNQAADKHFDLSRTVRRELSPICLVG